MRNWQNGKHCKGDTGQADIYPPDFFVDSSAILKLRSFVRCFGGNVDTNTLISLLFSGGTALAGLILIFLGGTINAYDAYDATQKPYVRKKYLLRSRLGFTGFLLSVISALTALLRIWVSSPLLITVSLTTILFSFGILVLLAFLAVYAVQEE
jgi:hypothetical protein